MHHNYFNKYCKYHKRRKQKVFQKSFIKGSFSIEASLLSGIILPVLIALLICGFYVHDRGVLCARVCETAALGSTQAAFSASRHFTGEESSSEISLLILRARSPHITYERTDDSICVHGSGSFPFPGFTAVLLGQGDRVLEESWERRLYHPVELIRQVRAWKHTADAL